MPPITDQRLLLPLAWAIVIAGAVLWLVIPSGRPETASFQVLAIRRQACTPQSCQLIAEFKNAGGYGAGIVSLSIDARASLASGPAAAGNQATCTVFIPRTQHGAKSDTTCLVTPAAGFMLVPSSRITVQASSL
jgi:hypothetical protein